MIKHLLTGEELSKENINTLLNLALQIKKTPHQYKQALKDKQLALLFEKPSLRTRFSFISAMQQLGGQVIEGISSNQKNETPADQIRVIQSYCNALMIRTFDDSVLNEMATFSKIPIINGLTDKHHPCQILADLLTIKECFSNVAEITVTYIGDGNNILHSLLLLAPQLGITINYSCPNGFGPDKDILEKALHKYAGNLITQFSSSYDAVKQSDVVYTDVWQSMGESNKDLVAFKNHQVNESIMNLANPDAVFFHCMPMVRGQEVSHSLPEAPCSRIFQQTENRLHIQKALILFLLDNEIQWEN